MSWQWLIALSVFLIVICMLGAGLESALREILSELRDINRATDRSRDLLDSIEGAAWSPELKAGV